MASLALSSSLSVPTSYGLRTVVCYASSDASKQASHPDKTSCIVSLKNVETSRRQILSAVSGAFLFSLSPAAMALLEADDDEALLEKVKEDRKKKIKKRSEVNTFKEEAAFVQAAVYQLSKAGQALDGNDFAGASKILGENKSENWIVNVEKALSKVSSSTAEKSEAKTFSTELASLQSAVLKQDLDLSKSSFVKSAGALERWSYMTGFSEQLKGL